ncbi:MAG: ATP-binding protein [Solirubrobacterales bacterium]
MASTLDEDALFEREVELGRLAGALDDAARGDGRAILVLGEPGIGKTSLLKATVE